MKLQAFATDPNFNGGIHISLFPNGFDNSGRPQFSLLFGLHEDDTSLIKDIQNPIDLLNDFGRTLNSTSQHLKLQLWTKDATARWVRAEYLDSIQAEFFKEEHFNLWSKLLSRFRFILGKKFVDKNRSSSEWISDTLKTPEPFYKDHKSPDYGKFGINMVSSIAQEKANKEKRGSTLAEKAELRRIEREKLYSQIDGGGQRIVSQFSRYHQPGMRSPDRLRAQAGRSLIETINSIFQHPTMARTYGLIYDFSLPDNIQYLLEGSHYAVTLELTADFPNHNLFKPTVKPCRAEVYPDNDSNSPFVLDIIKVETRIINHKKYHGLDNFGLITLAGYEFSTTSRDNDIFAEKISIEALNQAGEVGQLLDPGSVKQKVTDGLYLYQTPDASHSVRNLNDNNCDIGVLGQSINTYVTVPGEGQPNGNSSHLFSLCKREATYTMRGGLTKKQIEEGWLFTHLAMGASGPEDTQPGEPSSDLSYHPQTIFHWTGKNLCLSNITGTENKDVRQPNLAEKQRGMMLGTYEYQDEANDRIVNSQGYEVSYASLASEEIQFFEGNTYSFLIKQVLSNGYTFPLKPTTVQHELCISDLLTAERNPLNRFWISMDKPVTLDEDRINPPHFVSDVRLDKNKSDELISPEMKTPEASNHLVLYDAGQKTTRRIFPPEIDLKFANYLGMLSAEKLNSQSPAAYKIRGAEIVNRSCFHVPSDGDYPPQPFIKYLPDIRGTSLVLTPANWYTRQIVLRNPIIKKDGFFLYDLTAPNLGAPVAGSIEILPTVQYEWKITGNKIEIGLPGGLDLKFNIQVQDTDLLTSFRTEVTGLADEIKRKVLFSETHHPGFARGEFFITHPIKSPEAAKVISGGPYPDVIIASRPKNKTEANKVFYTFKLKDPKHYEGVKCLRVTSTYTLLMDEGTPSETALATWKSQNPNMDLLLQEYPSSAFHREFKQLKEEEVYKNLFGFSFNFEPAVYSVLEPGDKFIQMSIGSNFDIILTHLKRNDDLFTFILAAGPDEKREVERRWGTLMIFQVNYNFEGDALTCKVFLNDEPIITLSDTKLIPYSDFGPKNLSLIPKLEQKLLSLNVNETILNIFRFDYCHDYFVFRTEQSAGAIRKKIYVEALSRFPEFYPGQKKDELYSKPSNTLTLNIPNNTKPVVPKVHITPLILRLSAEGVLHRKRSMQLMLELDRPLVNEEKLALLITDNGVVTTGTSAIGRDVTTFSDTNFYKDNHGIPLTEFLDLHPATRYQAKYLGGNSTHSTYNLMLLEPFFEKEKQKWVVVIGFDQEKLRKYMELNLNAYNPFLRLVTANFIDFSPPENRISDFALSQYINLQTERSVKITTTPQRNWQITIVNQSQLKYDDQAKKRTRFIACLRVRGNNGINGNVVESIKVSSGGAEQRDLFHLFQTNEIQVKMENNRLICIYEFETFDNELPSLKEMDLGEDPKINWLDESRLRLVSAFEFIGLIA